METGKRSFKGTCSSGKRNYQGHFLYAKNDGTTGSCTVFYLGWVLLHVDLHYTSNCSKRLWNDRYHFKSLPGCGRLGWSNVYCLQRSVRHLRISFANACEKNSKKIYTHGLPGYWRYWTVITCIY